MAEGKAMSEFLPFSRPAMGVEELAAVKEVLESGWLTTGPKNQALEQAFCQLTGNQHAIAVSSATAGMHITLMALEIGKGDEVITPSLTWVSTLNMISLLDATPVMVDVDRDTLMVTPEAIESAITPRTKAIIPVHYAGVACEMDTIMDIAKRHNLKVVEDAAQGVLASYKGKALGTIGDFGAYSFHETKNYSMGEGGALLIRDKKDVEEAEIMREKGTNRSKFFRGQIDKYTWVNYGSSYLPSDMNAAYLYAQLEIADEINEARLACWNRYYEQLLPLKKAGKIDLPTVPEGCVHNAHMFYIKARDLEQRTRFISYMKENGVLTVFHYIPLHTSPAGQKFGRFHGEDRYTTRESERLVRLPMYYGLTLDQVDFICGLVKNFFELEEQ